MDPAVEPAYPDSPDTEVIPVTPAGMTELPDLALVHRRGRVPPSHVGSGRRRTDQRHPHRGRHRTMIAGRAIAAVIAVLALALTGGAWQWQSAKNNMLNRVSALDPDSRDILDPNAQFGDENFLIVGVDSRIGANSDMGAGTTDDAAGARSDTVMLVNIPANRERVVAVSFPRDLTIEPMECEPWNPETGEYGPITDPESPMYGAEEVYTEYKLNSAYAVGGPKCLVKVDSETVRPVREPFHGSGFRGLLEDGRRTRRCRGVQHHPAGGLRIGHRAAHRGPPDGRRPHRTSVCAGPPGRHRDQRRLRPHQTPAVVPVLTAALDDLQGSVLLAVQAQQRGQHVHRRQLRRQHEHQGPCHPGPVDSGHRRGTYHLPHRADDGLHGRVRQRASARGRQPGHFRRDHQ